MRDLCSRERDYNERNQAGQTRLFNPSFHARGLFGSTLATVHTFVHHTSTSDTRGGQIEFSESRRQPASLPLECEFTKYVRHIKRRKMRRTVITRGLPVPDGGEAVRDRGALVSKDIEKGLEKRTCAMRAQAMATDPPSKEEKSKLICEEGKMRRISQGMLPSRRNVPFLRWRGVKPSAGDLRDGQRRLKRRSEKLSRRAHVEPSRLGGLDDDVEAQSYAIGDDQRREGVDYGGETRLMQTGVK
ncbi:hypothetical protein DFH11DRAFT_1544875 [Phellopilus nigrolimitatus]|nr:hypothetical protein DFH11DRAFT_1544875 [Phellopilus nigrolimitatus]